MIMAFSAEGSITFHIDSHQQSDIFHQLLQQHGDVWFCSRAGITDYKHRTIEVSYSRHGGGGSAEEIALS